MTLRGLDCYFLTARRLTVNPLWTEFSMFSLGFHQVFPTFQRLIAHTGTLINLSIGVICICSVYNGPAKHPGCLLPFFPVHAGISLCTCCAFLPLLFVLNNVHACFGFNTCSQSKRNF